MNHKEEQEQKQDINSVIFTSNDLLDDEYYSTWDDDYEFYKMKIKNVNENENESENEKQKQQENHQKKNNKKKKEIYNIVVASKVSEWKVNR